MGRPSLASQVRFPRQRSPIVQVGSGIYYIVANLFSRLELDNPHTKLKNVFSFKGILCEVPFFGGSALLLFYSVGAMASCNYIPQMMLNDVF